MLVVGFLFVVPSSDTEQESPEITIATLREMTRKQPPYASFFFHSNDVPLVSVETAGDGFVSFDIYGWLENAGEGKARTMLVRVLFDLYDGDKFFWRDHSPVFVDAVLQDEGLVTVWPANVKKEISMHFERGYNAERIRVSKLCFEITWEDPINVNAIWSKSYTFHPDNWQQCKIKEYRIDLTRPSSERTFQEEQRHYRRIEE